MIKAMRGLVVSIGAIVGIALSVAVVSAWTGPSGSPPNSNVSAPINVGSTAQIKNGDVGVNNFSVFGNALLSGLGVGSGRYLNFDYTSGGTSGTGSSGYGIRDNAGTLEFKNLGGSWSSLQSTITSLVGQWTTSGNNIYNSNSGNVGIGVPSPSYKLDVSATVRASAFLYSSDARLKDSIEPLTGNLARLEHISPATFVWNSGAKEGQKDIGVIAQDVEKVAPEVVSTDKEGMKAVDYPRLVPILIGAIQEQQKEIDALRAEIEELKATLQ